MKGIVGFIIILLGVAIFALIFMTVLSKVLRIYNEPINSVNPKQIQNTVDDLRNKLQQKQNEGLGD